MSLAVLTDGKWEPAKDIPAAWKLAQAASVTLAAAAFGIHELLELATSLGLL